jgi:nitroimidazol reductase NimA-like FMN-containing flavoprotein (pyridoxamine 5'-phosphate oxidase superfamily)
MPKDYASLPPNRVRRADREVKDEGWIKAFLHRAAYASIATCFDGRPFITPRIFVYDEAANAIYVHGARVGRFAANVERNPRVCLNVSKMGRLLPAEEAAEFCTEYEGVTVFGEARLAQDREEAVHALQLLLDKYFPHLRPGEHYRPITQEELRRTAVFRINVEMWSGKQKRKSEDFPGAFFYDEDVEGLPGGDSA